MLSDERDDLRSRRPKTWTKREIAPRMRAALEAGAAARVTDHGGYLR
jgi:hypothetical protein